MTIPDHISESLVTIVGIFSTLDPRRKYSKTKILDKHPGSATLGQRALNDSILSGQGSLGTAGTPGPRMWN
jgi:hypothetical protein